MKATVFCLSFLVVVALVKADGTTVSPFENLSKQVAEGIEQGFKKFQELTGIQTEVDKEKVLNFFKTASSKLQERFTELSKNLEKDAKPYSDEIKKLLDNFNKQYAESLKSLNNPDTQAKLQKFQETFQASLKKVAEQANEVAKSAGVALPPSVSKSLNEIYDEISKTGHKIQEKGQQIVAEVQAELAKKKKN